MSNFVVYIHVEPFVRQWLIHAFGYPVEFPAQSAENATIRIFLMRQPDNVIPKHDENDIAVNIPWSKAKDPRTFNYLSKHGRDAVVEVIEDNFKRNMWAELSQSLFEEKVKVTTAVYAWCEKHGIDIEYGDTIRQRFYRMRNSYTKKGVDMMRHSKIYDE